MSTAGNHKKPKTVNYVPHEQKSKTVSPIRLDIKNNLPTNKWVSLTIVLIAWYFLWPLMIVLCALGFHGLNPLKYFTQPGYKFEMPVKTKKHIHDAEKWIDKNTPATEKPQVTQKDQQW